MELIAHLLGEFFAFHVENLREFIYVVCRDHPFVTSLLSFAGLIILIAIVAPSLKASHREFNELWESRRGKWLLLIGIVAALTFSACAVVAAVVLLGPIPVLDNRAPKAFVREPAIVKWNYDPLGPTSAPIIYEVQSSRTRNFINDDKTMTSEKMDSSSTYSFQPGARFWRVRATSNDGQSYGRWSGVAETHYYADAYSRIKATTKIIVFVSNSTNQAFFKFINAKGELAGADIEIAKGIAEQLTTQLRATKTIDVTKTIQLTFWPVSWSDLLNSPKGGSDKETPDIIISSISKRASREQKHEIRFSNPYFCTTQSLIQHKDQLGGPLANMLENKTIGYPNQTTSQELLEQLRKRIDFNMKPYDDTDKMIEAVRRKSGIQLAVTDTPFAIKAVKKNPNHLSHQPLQPMVLQELGVPADQQVDRYAIAVHNGEQECLEDINTALGKLNLPVILNTAIEAYATRNGLSSAEMLEELQTSGCQ